MAKLLKRSLLRRLPYAFQPRMGPREAAVVVVVEGGGGGRMGRGAIFKQEPTILATILPMVNPTTPPKGYYLPTI